MTTITDTRTCTAYAFGDNNRVRCGRPATHNVQLNVKPGLTVHPRTAAQYPLDMVQCAEHAADDRPLSVLVATVAPLAAPADGAAGPAWTAMRRQDFDTAVPLTLLDPEPYRAPSAPTAPSLFDMEDRPMARTSDDDHAGLDAAWHVAFDALRAAGLEADAPAAIAAKYRAASNALNHANRSRDFSIATARTPAPPIPSR